MRISAVGIGAALLGLIGTVAHASLIGDTVGAKREFPTVGTVSSDLGTAIVGPGIEFVPGLGINIDFGAGTLTLTEIPDNTVGFFDAPFNGFAFTDLTTPFTSASVDPATDVPGFTAADLTLTGGELFVNLQSLSIDGPSDGFSGTQIVIDLATSVPEPSSLALLAAAVAGFVLAGKKRRWRLRRRGSGARRLPLALR